MDVPDPAQSNAILDALKKLSDAVSEHRGSLLLGALLVVLFALAAIDGMFKHFRAMRGLWQGVRVSGGYLRDLFTGPSKVRRLEEWQARFSHVSEPVHHLGAVWFPSDVEANRFAPFCQYCWADGKRIALDVTFYQETARMYCRRNPQHGAGKWNDCAVAPEADYKRALEHVYDLRISRGA